MVITMDIDDIIRLLTIQQQNTIIQEKTIAKIVNILEVLLKRIEALERGNRS